MDKVILVSAEVGLTPLAIKQMMAPYSQREIPALYAAEYDLPFFMQSCTPTVVGMLVGYPFGGVSEDMVLSYMDRAIELDCQRFVLTLGTNDLASSEIESFRKKISLFARKAHSLGLEVVWEIPAALLTDAQVEAAVQVFVEVEGSRLSLSTNSELDVLDFRRLLSIDRMVSAIGNTLVLEIAESFPREDMEKLGSPFVLREYIKEVARD